jgi:hypothetical protein
MSERREEPAFGGRANCPCLVAEKSKPPGLSLQQIVCRAQRDLLEQFGKRKGPQTAVFAALRFY